MVGRHLFPSWRNSHRIIACPADLEGVTETDTEREFCVL